MSTNYFIKDFHLANGTIRDIPINPVLLRNLARESKEAYNSGKLVNNGELSYIPSQREGATVVFIRGTDNVQNIITDLDARIFYDEKIGINLHRGFRDAAEDIYNDLLVNYNFQEEVWFVGHSLGGAIAQILALWFKEDGYDTKALTYGSPSVTTEKIDDFYHIRVIIKTDPIPFLPPFPYVHSGVEIDAETLEWNFANLIGDITKVDSRDHSIDEYISALEEHECPTCEGCWSDAW